MCERLPPANCILSYSPGDSQWQPSKDQLAFTCFVCYYFKIVDMEKYYVADYTAV